jgi:RES domain-containing protein
MAYTSTTPELARLEHAVHIPYARVAVALVFAVAELPDDLVERLPDKDLPPDWDAVPSAHATAAIGDAWISSTRGLALAVPSALIPRSLTSERNILINPAHPAFARIRVRIVAFRHDPR